jgi:hypothetical protein
LRNARIRAASRLDRTDVDHCSFETRAAARRELGRAVATDDAQERRVRLPLLGKGALAAARRAVGALALGRGLSPLTLGRPSRRAVPPDPRGGADGVTRDPRGGARIAIAAAPSEPGSADGADGGWKAAHEPLRCLASFSGGVRWPIRPAGAQRSAKARSREPSWVATPGQAGQLDARRAIRRPHSRRR